MGANTHHQHASIKEDGVVLVQNYTAAACQLKAPTILGGDQPKTPVLNCKHF